MPRSPEALDDALRERVRSHLATFLTRVEGEVRPEQALENLQEILFAGLPDQISRMESAINTGEVAFADLPQDLVKPLN